MKKAMKSMKAKAKAMKAMKAKAMKGKCAVQVDCDEEKAPAQKKTKPASWLRERPTGCSKCRYSAGCTLSCWKGRGGPPDA